MSPKRNAARVPKQTYRAGDLDDDTIEEVDAEPEPALPSAKRVRASATKTRHVEDTDNAPPQSSGLGQETQQFAAAIEAFQKQQTAPKDTFLAKFVKEAERKRAEIAELPKKRDCELAEQNSAFVKAFNAQISTAMSTPTATSNDQGNRKPRAKIQQLRMMEDHPLYEATNAWLYIGRQTLDTYNSACQLVVEANPSDPLGVKWQEEADALIEILEMGKRVTQRQIDAMMERKDSAVPRVEEEMEAENARSLLGMKLNRNYDVAMIAPEHSVSWVESVKCAERGVKRLVGGIPAIPLEVE